jgi:hypothetical protein
MASLTQAVTKLTCVASFFYTLIFMTMPLESITESKHKCPSNYEAKKICKIMTLDEETKIPGEVNNGMNTAAVGLTFC